MVTLRDNAGKVIFDGTREDADAFLESLEKQKPPQKCKYNFWIRLLLILPMFVILTLPMLIFLLIVDDRAFGRALKKTGERFLNDDKCKNDPH